MKKNKILLSVILFMIGFAAAYLFLCYHPSLRLRLDATPGVFFLESIKYNLLNKSILSCIFGAILAFVPKFIKFIRNKVTQKETDV